MTNHTSIGTESEAAWGRSRQSEVLLPIPENKREMPCETCDQADICAAKMLECSAFRNWAARGDYKDADVARLTRGCK